jgi:hypothetical protein
MNPTDKIVISELHNIPDSYPKYENNQAFVYAYKSNGSRTRAMFYWNGGKPTFAAYGTDITDSVVMWEYNYDVYTRYGKEIPQ